MLKTETMPAMMAWRTEPMPLTIAMRQAPMVWKTDLIWRGGRLVRILENWGLGIGIVDWDVTRGGKGELAEGGFGLTQDTTAPILNDLRR